MKQQDGRKPSPQKRTRPMEKIVAKHLPSVASEMQSPISVSNKGIKLHEVNFHPQDVHVWASCSASSFAVLGEADPGPRERSRTSTPAEASLKHQGRHHLVPSELQSTLKFLTAKSSSQYNPIALHQPTPLHLSGRPKMHTGPSTISAKSCLQPLLLRRYQRWLLRLP